MASVEMNEDVLIVVRSHNYFTNSYSFRSIKVNIIYVSYIKLLFYILCYSC